MSPGVVQVRFSVDEPTWRRVLHVVEAQGWRVEEGVRILVGYGGAVALGAGDDDPVHALGALRGELASLRHRAYMADEAVRNLQMNLTGLNAEVTQAERSLAWATRQLADLEVEAAARGVDGGAHGAAHEPTTQERLMAFLGKSRERPDS